MVLCTTGGDADMGRIYRLCHALDSLQSRWSGANVRHHQRHRMKMAALPHPLEDPQPSGRATQVLQQVALWMLWLRADSKV